jgi:hypothetical protein
MPAFELQLLGLPRERLVPQLLPLSKDPNRDNPVSFYTCVVGPWRFWAWLSHPTESGHIVLIYEADGRVADSDTDQTLRHAVYHAYTTAFGKAGNRHRYLEFDLLALKAAILYLANLTPGGNDAGT